MREQIRFGRAHGVLTAELKTVLRSDDDRPIVFGLGTTKTAVYRQALRIMRYVNEGRTQHKNRKRAEVKELEMA